MKTGAVDEKTDAMDDWVYAERFLLSSFDHGLAESHGIAQLSRALNSDRLVAVIGSGIGAGYGHPNWRDLLGNMVAAVIEYCQEDLEANFKKQKHCRAADIALRIGKLLSLGPDDQAQINKQKNQFKTAHPSFEKSELWSHIDSYFELRLNDTDSFDNNMLPIGFELCENLFTAIFIWEHQITGQTRVRKLDTQEARARLRNRIKWQVKDDRGRLEFFLRKLLVQHANTDSCVNKSIVMLKNHVSRSLSVTNKSDEDENLAAAISLVFYETSSAGSETKHWLSSVIFQFGRLNKNASRSNEIFNYITDLWNPDQSNHPDRNGYDQKAAIETALLMLGEWSIVYCCLAVLNMAKRLSAEPLKLSKLVTEARASKPRLYDPITILQENLGVRRYMTTNYDREFDRYLESRGFVEQNLVQQRGSAKLDTSRTDLSTGSRTSFIDPSMRRGEIMAYEPGASPYLFDFGSNTHSSRVQWLHIHGRAQREDSWLVLSERDYRERYTHFDSPATQSDDAMRLIFNTNPLLFLGLGMSEPDITRPLRSFAPDDGRLTNRPAIALMPTLASQTKRNSERIEALSRFGVYYLYYGAAAFVFSDDVSKTEKDSLEKLTKKYCPDLMFHICGLLRDIAAALQDKTKTGANKKRMATKKKYAKLIGLLREVEGQKILIDPEGRSEYRSGFRQLAAEIIKLFDFFDGQLNFSWKLKKQDDITIPAILHFRNSLFTSALTIFHAAWLRELAEEQSSWRKDWSGYPVPRELGGKRPNSQKIRVKRSQYTLIAQRHRHLLRDLKVEKVSPKTRDYHERAPETDRFFAGAPSPALQGFRAALQLDITKSRIEIRRVFFLIGERGIGRGQIFAALRSEARFAQLVHWLGWSRIPEMAAKSQATTEKDAMKSTAHIHRAFFNLGVSLEVLSVFDSLSTFLEEATKKFFEVLGIDSTDAEHIKWEREVRTSDKSRIQKLNVILQWLNDLGSEYQIGFGPQHPFRIIITINHFSTFFSKSGWPKNGQAKILSELLFDGAYKNAPIDWLLLFNENHMPRYFRNVSPSSQQNHADYSLIPPKEPESRKCSVIMPKGLTLDDRKSLEERLSKIGLDYAWHDDDEAKFSESEEGYFVHFLSPMRVATMGLRFFPRAALALSHISDKEVLGSTVSFRDPSDSEPANGRNLALATIEEIRDFQIAVRERFQEHLSTLPDQDDGKSRADGDNRYESYFHQLGLKYRGSEMHVRVKNALADYRKKIGPPEGTNSAKVINGVIEPSLDDLDSLSSIKEPEMGIDYFAQIANAAGNNRYAMTVILAVVDDMIARRFRSDENNIVNLDAVKIFLNKLSSETAGIAPEDRAEIAIKVGLKVYQNDVAGADGKAIKPWPFEPKIARPSKVAENELETWTELSWVNPHTLYELQQRILTTLALVGQPVDATVLTGFDEIAETLERLAEECEEGAKNVGNTIGGIDISAEWKISWEQNGEKNLDNIQPFQEKLSEKSSALYYRQHLMLRVLDLLVHRCLIFRIAPKDDHLAPSGNHTTDYPFARVHQRYATHKTMRRYIFQEFKIPQIDYADIDQLTVSQYITQPSDLPKPTASAHKRIRHLIDQFSLFEKYDGDAPHRLVDPFQTNGMGKGDRVRVERGRVRAAYGALRSIYSLGVVSRFNHDGSEDKQVLAPESGYFESHRKRVRWLLRKAQMLDGQYPPSEKIKNEVRCLHAEEIVWLFNEAGVLSLTEGRIGDARTLLLQARNTAHTLVEEKVEGPLIRRILLNKVMADIESGHIPEARKTLERMSKVEGETDIFYYLVIGYRGLVNCLRGNLTHGIKRLDQAISNLRRMKRYRATAIFLMHKAVAHGELGQGECNHAREAIEEAIKLAAMGQHEDVRQTAELFRIRLNIEEREDGFQAFLDLKLLPLLQPIEEYGNKMGMPGLLSRIALCKSRYSYLINDYHAAAEAAQEALKHGTIHDMGLVKIEALFLLGQAMKKQSVGEADVLLSRAAEMAAKADYQVRSSAIAQAIGRKS